MPLVPRLFDTAADPIPSAQPHGPAPWGARPTDALPQGAATVNEEDINVLALVKGPERYIFLFDDRQRAQTLRTLGRFASNSELSFSWYDAAVLSQKVRQLGPASKSPNRISLTQSTDEE